MGVCLENQKKTKSLSCGYGFFHYIRETLAFNYDPDFYSAYHVAFIADFLGSPLASRIARQTLNIYLSSKIEGYEEFFDFFFLSDCGGSVSPEVCRTLADLIDEGMFGEPFGYENLHQTWKDFADLLNYCSENKERLIWW